MTEKIDIRFAGAPLVLKQGGSLPNLQDDFQNYLKTSEPIKTNPFIHKIRDDQGLSALARLQIYYDAYRLRLLEIIESDFPKLKVLMGEERFIQMGHQYIDKFPSTHFSVRYFSRFLSDFLKEMEAYKEQPFYAELAEFEWALEDAMDAANAPLLKIEALKKVPIEAFGEIKLKFHPSLQLKHFHWNIPSIWNEIDLEKPPLLKQNENAISWIIFREELSCAFRSCGHEEAILLKAFQSGRTFADACECLLTLKKEEEIPSIALGSLQQWFSDGIISELEFQERI